MKGMHMKILMFKVGINKLEDKIWRVMKLLIR